VWSRLHICFCEFCCTRSRLRAYACARDVCMCFRIYVSPVLCFGVDVCTYLLWVGGRGRVCGKGFICMYVGMFVTLCVCSARVFRAHVAFISCSHIIRFVGVMVLLPVYCVYIAPAGLSRCSGNAFGSVSSASCSACSPGFFCSAGTCLDRFNTRVCQFEKDRIHRHAKHNIGRHATFAHLTPLSRLW
jgi:hypothetical protein